MGLYSFIHLVIPVFRARIIIVVRIRAVFVVFAIFATIPITFFPAGNAVLFKLIGHVTLVVFELTLSE